MLGDAAQRLVGDIFQKEDLFRDAPRVRKRIVKWGADAIAVEHSAVVVSEEYLLDRLPVETSEDCDVAWTICAAPPLRGTEHRFGSRMASAVKVELKEASDACWIESVEEGWLFLLAGWLLSVDASLESSALIKEQIAGVDGPVARFPASPRIVMPLGGPGWISCGSAAMGFDPLCGDGTAHAVREAILACAVIRSAERGEELGELMAHYEARLTAGFQRHLAQCREFYSSGGKGRWWIDQVATVDEGLAWCRKKLEGHEFRYRMVGLELEQAPGVRRQGERLGV
jgi:hypothetical protein